MTKFIQISDCHIDDQTLAMGSDTQANLKTIIKEISNLEFDALLISGDLTHNGTLNSYELLQEILSPIKQPIYVFGGNHDNANHLNQIFKNNLFNSFSLGKWSVVSIDSVQPNKTSGWVAKEALKTLDETLKAVNSEHVIVALHHPIVPMNSSWDDELSLENPQDLFQVLNKYSKIRGVVFGHAHEAAEFAHDNFKIISCPSTALQFTSESRIGFNKFDLRDDGQLDWQTQWI